MGQKPEFAHWLGMKRKDVGNQDQVATKMGISRSTLTRWETGRYLPSIEHIQSIADCLGVGPDEVARRAGIQMETEVSAFALSLARMIECRTAALSQERRDMVVKAVDSVLTACSM